MAVARGQPGYRRQCGDGRGAVQAAWRHTPQLAVATQTPRPDAAVGVERKTGRLGQRHLLRARRQAGNLGVRCALVRDDGLVRQHRARALHGQGFDVAIGQRGQGLVRVEGLGHRLGIAVVANLGRAGQAQLTRIARRQRCPQPLDAAPAVGTAIAGQHHRAVAPGTDLDNFHHFLLGVVSPCWALFPAQASNCNHPSRRCKGKFGWAAKAGGANTGGWIGPTRRTRPRGDLRPRGVRRNSLVIRRSD